MQVGSLHLSQALFLPRAPGGGDTVLPFFTCYGRSVMGL